MVHPAQQPRPSLAPILIAGLLCFSAGGLYAWSAMIPALQARYATSGEQAGLVFSIAIAIFSASVLLAPRLPLWARGLQGAGVFGIVGAFSLGLTGLAPGFFWFVIAYSVGFGFCSGAIYILVLDIAAATPKPRLVTAIMVAAFGFGGVVFGPLQRLLIAAGWGLSAIWVLAVALGCASLAGLIYDARRPGPRSVANDLLPPDGVQGSRLPLVPGHVFWLWAGFGLGSAAGLMVLGLATTIIESRGGSIWLSSLAIFGIAGGNTFGRLSAGVMQGWLRLKWMVPIAMGLSIVGLVAAAAFSDPMLSALGLIAVASGYGLTASSFPILTRQSVGHAAFARTYSIVFTAWGAAGLLSPWLAGRLFDTTGNFTLALICALGASVAALAISLRVTRQLPP